MGIDGIGKPGGAPPIDGGLGSSGVGGAAKDPFRVESSTASEVVQPSDPLSRFERGELGLDGYLEARVEDAVRHLEGKLVPEQLEFVKQSLRDQMASDPVLVELVRRATGTVPSDNQR
jgi:hypothetical protein